MKKIALLAITAFLLAGTTSCFAAQKFNVSPQVSSAISMYKQQNYTGALQELQEAVKKAPNDVLAQYYLALAYVQLGMKPQALEAFNGVIQKDAEGGLGKISQKAVDCYNDAQKCEGAQKDDMTEFLKSTDFLYKDVKSSLQDVELKQVMDKINSGEKNPDFSKYKYLNDASDAMPTNDEIANAVKVLAKVGFNPLAQGVNTMYSPNVSPQLSQLNMVMGQTNTSGNAYMNMLPYLMMSQGTGDTTGNSKIDPRLLQSMMLSQMVDNFGFDNNNKNNRNY